jgi:peptidoglycan/LPS O-acetylase OafA/YrhL
MAGAAAASNHLRSAVQHDIPSLDGLRAVSIAIVILSHTKALLPAVIVKTGLFRYLIGGGLHGVQIFFVISGYLITMLLLREFNRTRDISLTHFYVRRALRIFPPFYVYLAVLAVLWIAGQASENWSTFFSAATYTIVFHPNPQGWFVQHAWSLSIEEQFYLLWPALVLVAQRHGKTTRLAFVVLAVMPMARAILFFASAHQGLDHNRLLINSGAIDMLLAGCLLALLREDVRWREWFSRRCNGWLVLGLLGAALILVPYADNKLRDTWLAVLTITLGFSVTAIAIALAVEYVVRKPESIVGRVLNFRPIRHVGIISYSIYLWQQLFTQSPLRFGIGTYALILIAAEISFWVIERPMMRVRGRLQLGTPQFQAAERVY